jgi:hypothetical protein
MRGRGRDFEVGNEIKVQPDVTGGPSSIEHHFSQILLGMSCLHGHIERLAVLTEIEFRRIFQLTTICSLRTQLSKHPEFEA